MTAVALALGVSLFIGISDFLGGVTTRSIRAMLVIAVSQAIGFVPLVVAVALVGEATPDATFLPWALAASVAGGVSLTCFYLALAHGPMAVVAPIASLSALIPVTAGFLQGEQPGAIMFGGALVALSGTVVAAASTGDETAHRSTGGRRGIWLSLAGAVMSGFWVLTFREASAAADPLWATMTFRAGEIALLAVGLLVIRADWRPARGHLPALACIGALEVTATTMFGIALDTGLVSVVAVLAALYPATTMALAHVVLRERTTPVQLAGAVATLAGVLVVVGAAA